jgi:hypothetical protein
MHVLCITNHLLWKENLNRDGQLFYFSFQVMAHNTKTLENLVSDLE